MRRYMQDFQSLYEQKAKAAIVLPGSAEQLMLYSVHLLNRCASAQDMGMFIRMGVSGYKFGVLNGGVAVVDATSAIQAATPQSLFTTTANDGFLVQSVKKFGLVGFAVTQAQGAGAPVYAYQYYNGASYVALPDYIEVPDYSSVGDKLIVFIPPRDWAQGSTGAVGGDSDKYSLRVLATSAPAQDVIANDVWVGKLLHLQTGIANNGVLSLSYSEEYPKELDSEEGLLPYFSVASAKNAVTVKYFSHK